ncbi:MAG: hypothetical protein IKT57_02250 [Clostridia bacterium]|nr:hypothetical protein [Clostridia bacterium]
MEENKNENRRNMKRILRPWIWVMPLGVIGLVMVMIIIGGTGDRDTNAARGETVDELAVNGEQVRTEEYCTMVQTYRFIPCGHQVTRRVMLPGELVGENFDTVAGHYENWRLDTFSAAQVTMSRDEKIYCPMHVVLMPDEAGQVALFKNVYGDGMAYEEGTEYNMMDFSQETQQALFEGVGFDSRDEALAWLRAEVDNV